MLTVSSQPENALAGRVLAYRCQEKSSDGARPSLSSFHGYRVSMAIRIRQRLENGLFLYRHGPARPGHLLRHVLVAMARTSRAMTMEQWPAPQNPSPTVNSS
ncbi:MAG: hypothetical protein ACJ8AI_31865 [Rhodopila sp.]